MHKTEVFVDGDPLTSDQLTMTLLSNISNINVTLQRSPSSILMEDMDLMQLFFKRGKLKIEKEQLPVSNIKKMYIFSFTSAISKDHVAV